MFTRWKKIAQNRKKNFEFSYLKLELWKILKYTSLELFVAIPWNWEGWTYKTYLYIHTFDNEILFLDCTEPAILEFPKDFLSEEVRNNGGIIIHVILATYLIFGLGTICDDFFVPVLEIISEKFHLSNDVAGATFMAAGKYVLVLL